jgi:hypothetical protein
MSPQIWSRRVVLDLVGSQDIFIYFIFRVELELELELG